MKHCRLFLALACWPVAAPAMAGEAQCWFENGVVVATASVMGVVGDYILDTATPRTQLAITQAQAAGFADTALSGEVRFAGERLEGRAVEVAAIDLRSGALPTPIAGVIGADVLRDYIVDVRFAPCRIALHRAGKAPPFPRAVPLEMTWAAGAPVIPATASEGGKLLEGGFAPAIGSDTAIRISDAVASVPGAAKPVELYPGGVSRPKLAALSFAGELFQQLPGGLLKAQDGGPAGVIGTPLLSAYRLRFDFPSCRLLIAKEKGPPERSDGP